MGVYLERIWSDPIFENATILAGAEGIRTRIVRRVSVFDCLYHESIAEAGIIEQGDLFISCLEQFQPGSSETKKAFEGLIRQQVAGVILIPIARVEVLNEEILELCEHQEFPIILLWKEMNYAHIMRAINSYISIEMENAINLLRLEKIRYGNLTSKEKIDILYQINKNTQKNICAIYVNGELLKTWFASGVWDKQIRHKQYSLIAGDYLIILLTNDDVRMLEHEVSAMVSWLKQLSSKAFFGMSRIYPIEEIERVLDEGESAVKMVRCLKTEGQMYAPLMPVQLLAALSGCREEEDFYNAYLEAISRAVSPELIPEILHTIEVFLVCDGNYRETAECLQQHENTVRYRIGQVRKALGMERNKIGFFEIIALATQINSLCV